MPRLTYVECPRDAWQGLSRLIPVAEKRAHLEQLLAAGFCHLDLASFVSPKAVPQMADSEAVLAGLTRPAGADFLAIIANLQGLERALRTPILSSVGYPLSVNETFQQRNTRRSLAQSWPLVAELLQQAEAGGLRLVAYVSMGFGNPYGEPWSPHATADVVARLRDLGVRHIALADTAGTATADRVALTLAACAAPDTLGLHLHAGPGRWRGLVEIGLEHGVCWFEGALAGVGGCPFATDALVGNLPSEKVVPFLAERLVTPIDLSQLPPLARAAATLQARYL